MASVISASTTSATALNMSADTTGVLQFATGATPTTAVTIDTSQNVGIGTTSPTNFGSNFKMFAVQGTDYGVIQGISNSSSTTIEMMAAGSIGYLGTRTNHPLALRTNDTERMRINQDGLFTNGATGSTTAWTATSGVFAQIGNASFPITATNSGIVAIFNRNTSTGTIAEWKYNGSVNGSVSTNGTNVSYNTSSDYRLKENIAPMTGALDKVAQLKPVTYKWKINGSDGQGFIAHELQAIIPDAVSGEKDAVDEEGNPIYQGVDTSFLVATLTAAIQEQQTIINDLKARIETLEAK